MTDTPQNGHHHHSSRRPTITAAKSAETPHKPMPSKPDPFPVELLPPVVRDYVTEGAQSRAADLSIVALPVLVTLAACIGTTRRIEAKKGWQTPSIIWGAVVARSGSVKSVGYDLANELLDPAEQVAFREHQESERLYKIAEDEHHKAKQQWSRKKGAGKPPTPPERPNAKRLVVDDQTIEGLAALINENPRGLYVLSDELRGWVDGMGAYSAGKGSGRDEARWLTLFDGRAFNYDRKTNRERIYARLTGVSVAGTIQPGTLAAVMDMGKVASGFLARLLLVMPEPRPKRWTEAEMSEATRLAMQRVIDRLKSLNHEIVDGFPKPIVLKLSDEARQRFIPFVNSHGDETFAHDDSLAAAWSKLEGYALRFALVHHLTLWASGSEAFGDDEPIGLSSLEAGIELSRWFAAEAERVYAAIGLANGAKSAGQQDHRHIARLAEWLRSKDGSATERDINKSGPRRYRKGEHVEADCRALIDQGRAKWDTGRKTRRIVLVDSGDAGDGDTLGKNTGEIAEVSPDDTRTVSSDEIDMETLAKAIGDTSDENTEEITNVSPVSTVSGASTGERTRLRI